jgi:D-arabinose 1-dehydrogenase-like Zn-dependent alcohol dehydrogenase
VPGHAIAGHLDAVGDHVTAWNKGQRVGVGWHGVVCAPCRRGDFAMCVHRQVTGFDVDSGYAEDMIARAEPLAAIPDALPAEDAGPLMCASVTVDNAPRHAGARAREVVAVHGIGGLGLLGVQCAQQLGFETVAITRGHNQASLVRHLGAQHDIDALAQEAVTALQTLGGTRVIRAPAPNAPAIAALMDGLSPSGTLLVPAAPAEPLTIRVLSRISGRRSVAGWYAGTAKDAQETLACSVLSAVHPMIEHYPLGRVADADAQMPSGRVRLRVVLTVDA